jgi:hypothetical protein
MLNNAGDSAGRVAATPNAAVAGAARMILKNAKALDLEGTTGETFVYNG